jgi:2-oxoglutarate ferredoxin oxidoreductase subunit alpha
MDRLAAKGIYLNYMRVRAFPFGRKVERFIAAHEHIYVVEQNRDAQLRALLINETAAAKENLESILHYQGLPMDYRCIVEHIERQVARGEVA